ncbi:serine/threonine-protein kinaseY13-like [Populus alba x Populus x berolinensis]|nr:serine/threonine-protein kinaseY13-like [Populus alba x Populus x berolinensis]
MESSNGKEAEGAMKEEKSNTHQETETVSNAEETKLGSKVGSMSNKEMYFRADKIDFKSWDVQLEKHLSRAWSRDTEEQSTRKEEWEIDLGKLDIRHVIAYGTYGAVYRGNYDGQDVAVKVLDWGEDGIATAAETAALRASFKQEVAVWHKLDHPNVTKFVGASMGTSNLKIPSKSSSSDGVNSPPSRACCVVVEYLPELNLKTYVTRKLLSCNVKILMFVQAETLKHLRPEIPRCCPSSLAGVMRKCWDANPEKRPEMDEVVRLLEAIDTSKGGGMLPEDQSTGCLCFTPARGP